MSQAYLILDHSNILEVYILLQHMFNPYEIF